MTSIHTKECIIQQLSLPIELTDIIKSFVFYDIKTATTIKQTKKHKKCIVSSINETTFSGYKTENNRDIIETDDENYLFERSDIWLFGYINHPIETVQFQCIFCLVCGKYKNGIYNDAIVCNCVNDNENLPEFFL